MYLDEMSVEDFKVFARRFNNCELYEIKRILDSLCSRSYYIKIAVLSDSIRAIVELERKEEFDTRELSFVELKEMFNKCNILELSSFRGIVSSISEQSYRYKLMKDLLNGLLYDRREIVLHTNIRSMTYPEVRFFLENISTNSREWYALDCNSEHELVTPDEFYKKYHNEDAIMLERKCQNGKQSN